MTAAFTHADPGTPEAVWRDALRRRRLGRLDLDIDALVVVAAHPDDETLGAGGLIAAAAGRGIRVSVIIATDGEASHPRSSTHTPPVLADLRRTEVRQAVGLLAPAADLRFLGLPDGGLDERRAEFADRLDAVLAGVAVEEPSRVLVATTWAGDRHRDHRVTAETVASVVRSRGLRRIEYPIWAWHWGTPEDLPWSRAVELPLADDVRRSKLDALARHVTQVQPLSGLPGDEVLLHPGMQEHFHRDTEVFLLPDDDASPRATLPTAWFDAFYRRNGEDPWGFETRWYEERKRALLMATLPARALGSVLEIGCSTGLLTQALAARASSVTALDAAEAAVAAARDRLGDDPTVRVQRGAVPRDWPAGRFDTIVLSEVGYYLSSSDLARTVAEIDASLQDDGCLVACHWRHPVADYPQTGDEVHAALRAVETWEVLSRHEERDFVLEVFARRPVRSVAEAEGLV